MRRHKPSPPISTSGYLLDIFSQADIRQWKKASGLIEQYHVQLYYHLESLREIHSEVLQDALAFSGTQHVAQSSWFRLVDFKYSAEILSPKGSLIKGGRFNIGKDLNPGRFPVFPALYIAEDYPTAYTEYFGAAKDTALGGFNGHELALRDPGSSSSVRLSFELEHLFDLTNLSNLNAFAKVISGFTAPKELREIARLIGAAQPMLVSTSKQLRDSFLNSNWRNYPAQFEIPSNSQVFGRLLNSFGFNGIIYPSIKGKGKCIAIFTHNLIGSDSYIELVDEAPPGVIHTRLDAENCSELALK